MNNHLNQHFAESKFVKLIRVIVAHLVNRAQLTEQRRRRRLQIASRRNKLFRGQRIQHSTLIQVCC